MNMRRELLAAAVSVLMMTSTALQAETPVPLTPEKLWELGRLSPETVTPDGKYLIYGVTRFDMEANSSERNLYRIPVTGGQAEQITFGKGGESVVYMDPVGESMIYLHRGQLWRLDLLSRESRQLTDVD